MQSWPSWTLWWANGRSLCPTREEIITDRGHQRAAMVKICGGWQKRICIVRKWSTVPLTFSENVLYGRSMGWVFEFSSNISPYVQLFWICRWTDMQQMTSVTPYIVQLMLIHKHFKLIFLLTFSKAHLSCVYSAYLLMKPSNLSGMIVLEYKTL